MRPHSRSTAARTFRLGAALLLATLVPACGGGVQGKYVATETTPDGKLEMIMELKGGGKATMTMQGGGNQMSSEGTYTVDGDEVTVTIDGNPQTFTLDGGKLTGSIMGDKLEFKKQ